MYLYLKVVIFAFLWVSFHVFIMHLDFFSFFFSGSNWNLFPIFPNDCVFLIEVVIYIFWIQDFCWLLNWNITFYSVVCLLLPLCCFTRNRNSKIKCNYTSPLRRVLSVYYFRTFVYRKVTNIFSYNNLRSFIHIYNF